jgi:hypothetical protein
MDIETNHRKFASQHIETYRSKEILKKRKEVQE